MSMSSPRYLVGHIRLLMMQLKLTRKYNNNNNNQLSMSSFRTPCIHLLKKRYSGLQESIR